ncbi:MAG: FAD-dependent oxidoreductase, partial [Rhodobacteraceae bacterium]|nr:FAD-dependent oxidoreductase [Paracoccaceae bacterium]
MLAQLPLSKDLVLVGGGHSHALVMRHWAMNPLPGARLTVIDPTPIVAYSGMLPGFVAGHYSQAELSIDLNRLARAAGARLVVGAVSHIDPVRQLVSVPGYPDIGYDAASVDIGITSAMPTLPGFAKHGVPAKPLGPFAERWSAFVARVLAARETDAPLPDDVVIIGGGVAGAELAMAAAYALRGQGGPGARVLLVDRGTALSVLPARTRARMLAGLKAQNVELVEQAQVIAVHAGGVELASGRMLASAFTIGAAGALPHAWLSDCGLQMHEGFLCINAQLQSSDPLIFAAGDCAHMVENPRPKAGVFAVRQAPVLLENLRATLMDTPLRSYHPQHDYLKLISLGGKLALAGKWGFAASGPALWRWKDRIDRKFMNMLADLPQMPQPALPRERAAGLSEAQESTAMCGGCGAKVG